MANPEIARPAGETPVRSTSKASTGSQAATIHRCNVIAVNSANYTVDVRLEAHPYSLHFDVPYMVPYVHQAQGEGMNFMPEVGSTAWVCSPSETGRDSFVLGWTSVQESGTYRAGRELLNPGDLHFSTRDGNFLHIRRGGIVQIGATPVCQRIFLPIRNTIRDFAENWEVSTPAGDLTWNVKRTDEQGDGHRQTLFTLACKEFSDDPNKDPIATLKIGSHGEGVDTIISLETRDKGGGAVKTKLEITKTGKITWTLEKDLTLVVKGDYKATITGKMTTSSDSDMALKSGTKLTGDAPKVILTGDTGALTLDSNCELKGGTVKLGDADYKVVVDSPSFSAWVSAVTTALKGSPSVPAMKGPIPPASSYTSTKAKA